MKTSVLYGVVVKFENGGENMNSFPKESSALSNAKEIINRIKESKRKGLKVYMSKLEYDAYKNCIPSSNLINEESKLLFQS